MSGFQTFETERYFAEFEFSVRHLLAASDCESIEVAELLNMAGASLAEMGSLWLGYTEPQGSLELRTVIAAQYEQPDPDAVVVLNSPIEGIFLTMQTLLTPGDEVVVLLPAYDALPNLPEDLGAVVRPWYLVEGPEGWRIDLDALQAMIGPRTRLLVANFPHNPTGYLPTEDEFAALLELAGAAGIWLYHDEIFRGLEHGSRPRLPSAADRYERSVVLGGLSKTHGLPGLRAGWLVVRDAALRADVINTKMYTSICPPAPVEYLSIKALQVAERLAARNRGLVQANLGLAEQFFTDHQDMFTFHRPLAGPVGLARVHVPSAEEYCAALAREARIMLLPAKYLGCDDTHVRFGFGRRSFPESLAAYDAHLRSVAGPD